jgi:hypothetical protein
METCLQQFTGNNNLNDTFEATFNMVDDEEDIAVEVTRILSMKVMPNVKKKRLEYLLITSELISDELFPTEPQVFTNEKDLINEFNNSKEELEFMQEHNHLAFFGRYWFTFNEQKQLTHKVIALENNQYVYMNKQ